MENETKNKKISTSVIISLITLVISFLTSFLFTKFLLNQPQIGDSNYGLKSTVDSFVSFASIFTFGMSSTFVRFHKKYSHNEKDVFSTFNLITSVISVCIIIFGLILCVLTANNIILDPSKGVYTHEQVHDFLLILIISIAYTSLSVVFGNSKWFLESEKNIVFVRLVNLIVVIGYPVVSTFFVLAGANMVVVTLIYSIVYLFGFLACLFLRIKKTKGIAFLSYKHFNKTMSKEIIIFSFFVVLTSCVETFNHSVDKLILTISFTASLTTIYQLSLTLNQVLLSLADIIYAPFMPFLAEDIIRNEKDSVQKTYNHVTFILLFLSFFILIGFVGCGKEFVYLWVGEERELIYYFTIIIFATWPLYGMVKFSILLHRLSNKHIASAVLFVTSFIIHLIVTFSFIYLIDVWACVIGTAVSSVFLGITFIWYNKKSLGISQHYYLSNLLKLSICGLFSIGSTILFGYLCSNIMIELPLAFTMLVKGLLSILIFLFCFVCVYFRKTVFLLKTIFDDNYSVFNTGRHSLVVRIQNKLQRFRLTINNMFPFVFILYILFNFSSYYLGGIEQLKAIVESSVFTYGTKAISYLLIILYSLFFVFANRIKLPKRQLLYFSLFFMMSIISSLLVPKNVSFVSRNDYNWIVRTTLSVGLIDLIIGNINFFIDLFIMFLYLFVFRNVITRKNINNILRFIVLFSLAQCLYSFVFQYNDYLYFFAKSTGNSSFNGYSTNISGTFFSKNGFGFLLFQSIVSCFYLIKFDDKFKKVYIFSLILLNTVNIFSLCKTSLVSALFFDFVFLFLFIKRQWLKNRRLFWTVSISSTCVLVIAFLFFTPAFNDVPFLGEISKKIHEVFFVSGEATVDSRKVLWEYAIRLLKGPYVVFGYGKNVSSSFLNISSNFLTHTFHNSILDILCSFGLFGLVFYFYGIVYSSYETCKYDEDSTFKYIVFAVVVSTILYGLMEDVYLLMSSSSTMIVSSLILSTSSENYKKRKESEKRYVQISI